MKQKKGPLIILTLITYFIFKNNVAIQESILASCNLFFKKLFPSLFPMMILSDCFIYFGLPELLCKYLGKGFSKIFHTSPYGAFAFFISCFSGTPSNSYVIKNLYLNHYLTKEEAEKILSFAFFSNPLFLYSMLSLIFPNNSQIVIKLLILPYIVNILIGIFGKKSPYQFQSIMTKEKESFGTALAASIKNAMNTQLLILGSVSVFFLINRVINPQNLVILSGFLEISQGLNHLITRNLSLKIKQILAIFFISFGGLSIHLQIKGILSETDISYIKFLKGRIMQTILSIIIVILGNFQK